MEQHTAAFFTNPMPMQLTPAGWISIAGGPGGDNLGPAVTVRRESDASAVLLVANTGMNPTTGNQDRYRLGGELTLLASAARSASTTSPTQTFYNLRGILLFLNVTANPGGAETLTLRMLARDPVTGTLTPYVTGTAQFGGGGVGMAGLLVVPGAVAADHTLGVEAVASCLTRQGAAQVVHSGAGAWTYSLGCAVIV